MESGGGLTAGPRTERFHHRWDERNHDDCHNDDMEVALNRWNVSETIPGAAEKRDPCNPAADIRRKEAAVGHLPDAPDEGRERPQDRREPREDDGPAAIPVLEILRPHQVLLIDEAVLAGKRRLAEDLPPLVVP